VAEGESVTLSAEVKNLGTVATKTTTLTWQMDGQRIGEDDIPALEPGETKTREISHSLAKAGAAAFRAVLEGEDDLDLDNDAAVVVEAVDELPILIVRGGTLGGSERLSDMTFFTHALGYRDDQPTGDWHSLFKPKIVSAEELADVPLAEYRLLNLFTAAADFGPYWPAESTATISTRRGSTTAPA
jgi:hypothetical protein